MKNILGIIGLIMGSVLAKVLYQTSPVLTLIFIVVISSCYFIYSFFQKENVKKNAPKTPILDGPWNDTLYFATVVIVSTAIVYIINHGI